tara:strand:- start:584 stop:970 length:387 start_codon:yes stop_codon:yes gene_type:complete
MKGNHLKMTIDDGTSSIDAIKWNNSIQLEKNDLIDIAYYIEINRWKKANILQLNIVDIKRYTSVIDIHLQKKIYKCQFTEQKDILITNSNGQCVSSNFSFNSKNLNTKQLDFAKKILTFAEFALGKDD